MERQQRKFKTPIVVDARFLEGMETIAAELATKITTKLITKHGVTPDQEPPNTEDTFEIYDFNRAKEYLERDLREYAIPEFELAFDDGSSLHADSMERVKQALDFRPSSAQSVSFRVGSYGDFRAELRVGAGLDSSASSLVSGDREAVTHFDRAICELVASAEPGNSWLYAKKTWLTVGLFAGAVITISIFFIVTAIFNWWIGREFKPGIIPPLASTAVVGIGVLAIVIKIEKLFPIVEFDFSVSSRRRSGRRFLVLQWLSLLAVPLLLGIATALITSL